MSGLQGQLHSQAHVHTQTDTHIPFLKDEYRELYIRNIFCKFIIFCNKIY